MISTRLNLTAHLLDARIAEGAGDRVAIRTSDRAYSYDEVAQLSAQYANLLAADDIRPEERVIVALRDGVDFVAKHAEVPAVFGGDEDAVAKSEAGEIRVGALVLVVVHLVDDEQDGRLGLAELLSERLIDGMLERGSPFGISLSSISEIVRRPIGARP